MDLESHQPSVTHYELCHVMKNSGFVFTDCKNQLIVLTDFILSKFSLEGVISEDEKKEVEIKLRTFLAHAVTKYKNETRKFDQFVSSTKNSIFFQNTFSLPDSLSEHVKALPEEFSPTKVSVAKKPKVGRKSVPFDV